MAKVRLLDVAAAAGVSIATVDRVVNRRGGVAPAVEAQVLAAARRLGLDRRLDQAPARTLRVAVLIQPPANPFHAALRDGIEQARQIHARANLQFQIRHIDPNRPQAIAAAIRACRGRAEGLILCAPDAPPVAAAVAEVAPLLPVVTLATDIAASGRAAYVGPDDRQAGRVAGDLMGLFLGPPGGAVLMVAGRIDIAGQRARAAGFAEVLARQHPACHLARVIETGESRAETAGLVARALRDDPAICGIYHSTTGARELVGAVEGLARPPRIITHELTPNRRALLRARKLCAVIDQKPLVEARLAVECMARLLGRLEGQGASVATDIQIFMAENA